MIAAVRLADPAASKAWFHGLGLPDSAAIPVHVFVDPSNRVRCARASAVREQDYAAVEKLLAE